MEKWYIKKPKQQLNFKDINYPEYMKNILLNRELSENESIYSFLNPNLENLHPPMLLPDIIKASNIIIQAIMMNKRIRVVGDYDVDGITSTYILVRGLSKLGAKIDYKIPHRVNDGYGINKSIIQKAFEDKVDLIITCDNGIAAIDELSYAKELGIQVIVTDHHEVQKEDDIEILPNANAIVNPKRAVSKYPFSGICGAVVAFKLISQLFLIKGMDMDEFFEEFLPFAAIGTVCDVMNLTDENRVIVSKGIQLINDTQNIGLKALKEVSQIEGNIDVYHIGFIIGPTLNSSGRLESAEKALELFFSDSYTKALDIAKELRELNQIRQKLTEEGYEKVNSIINDYQLNKKLRVLMIKEESIDESIIGIVAGRIKEKYNKPAIIFTKSKDFLKGSGRSIDEYDMFENLQKFKSEFIAFGGHKMACGLSAEPDKLNKIIVEVNNSCMLTKEDFIKKVYIDTVVNLSEVTIEMINNIEKLKPFGNGNPKPLLASTNLKILNFSVLGKNNNVLKFNVFDGSIIKKVVMFKSLENFAEEIEFNGNIENFVTQINDSSDLFVDLVYSPVINEFRNEKNVELRATNIRLSRKK